MEEEKQYVSGFEMDRVRLAHAYIPYQQYTDHYTPARALKQGTLYPELYMPYQPGPRGYY